jgi:hypothetical protein
VNGGGVYLSYVSFNKTYAKEKAPNMTVFARRFAPGVVAVAVLVAGLSSFAASVAQACAAQGNAVVLTVAGGAVTAPNRPAFDEIADRFHAYRGNKFDKAHAFTLSDLAALPMQSVRAYSPYEQKVVRFDGPALDEVLKAAGAATVKSVILQAIDGYEVKSDPATLAADGQVLALCREGAPLPLGGLGPVFSTVPLPAGQDKATEEQINRQVWGLIYIAVE